MNSCDVAIVGAGPYGLSTAAHLKSAGVNFRIFGNAMEFWLKHMPNGMHLKSEGFASSLFDPGSSFTLKAFCNERGIPYADLGRPVPLDLFAAYGIEFQKRFVPELENCRVTLVQREHTGFRVSLSTGEVFFAKRVVVAVGLTHFAEIPKELAGLPQQYISHSSEYGSVEQFKGRQIAILGAGASALDLAALIHQSGASVQVISRAPKIRFHDPPKNTEPSWLDRIRKPITGIGPGWKLFMCTNLPLIFRLMPEQFRIEKVRKILGPAPCWFTKEQVVGKVDLQLGVSIQSAKVDQEKVALDLSDLDGKRTTIYADHIIAATGYKPDLKRLPFLDPKIISSIKCVDTTPALSANFESTVENLYFVGVIAANTFGPLLRFAYGAGFAAPRLSRHLVRTASETLAPSGLSDAESANDRQVTEPMAQ
jgi:thioredoxin reductase